MHSSKLKASHIATINKGVDNQALIGKQCSTMPTNLDAAKRTQENGTSFTSIITTSKQVIPLCVTLTILLQDKASEQAK